MQYRVHKSNIPQSLPSVEGFSFVRVVSNSKGISLDRVAFIDLPVVRHDQSGQLGRRATIIENIELDPSDADYALCTTKDVILPYDESELRVGAESPWTTVQTAPVMPDRDTSAKQTYKEGEPAATNLAYSSFSIRDDHTPLRIDDGGVVRVGNSRVSLDLVVEQYENGASPEDLVRAYDTLLLADVHDVIAYYLRHRVEVRLYLKRRADEAETLRAKIEAERPRVTRDELLARREAREQAHAATGQ